jgi:hypothetical protein
MRKRHLVRFASLAVVLGAFFAVPLAHANADPIRQCVDAYPLDPGTGATVCTP